MPYIKLNHSTNSPKGFDAGSETTAAYIEAPWRYQLWGLVLKINNLNFFVSVEKETF